MGMGTTKREGRGSPVYTPMKIRVERFIRVDSVRGEKLLGSF